MLTEPLDCHRLKMRFRRISTYEQSENPTQIIFNEVTTPKRLGDHGWQQIQTIIFRSLTFLPTTQAYK